MSLLSGKTEPYRSSRKYARPKLAGDCLFPHRACGPAGAPVFFCGRGN